MPKPEGADAERNLSDRERRAKFLPKDLDEISHHNDRIDRILEFAKDRGANNYDEVLVELNWIRNRIGWHSDIHSVSAYAGFQLEDPAAADETLHCLICAIERAKDIGRFRRDVDAMALATQSWAIGHGLVSLVATGPLPRPALDHGPPILTALFTSCGDDPDTCRRSVELGWHQLN
jgi:hypothetical protein